jgi:hypothetical protein
VNLPSPSRSLAFSIVMVGLLSFFWPLVAIDPPVAGVRRWSCFEIVQRMYGGDLPAPICETCDDPRIRALLALPFAVATGYCFTLAAALALCIRKSARAVIAISLIGGYGWIRGGWTIGSRLEFQRTFFGPGQGHVHYGALPALQIAVMGLLFLVALDLRDEERDEESSKLRQRTNNLVDAARESPRVMDAEIIEEDRQSGSVSPSEDPLLHD